MSTQDLDTRALQARTAELELMQLRSDTQLALTPIGQMIRQYEACAKMGEALARSTVIPKAYQGNPANCAVALDMAFRMKMPPMAVMQNLHVIQGNPSWSSKFLVACINASGKYTTPEYQFVGKQNEDSFGCRMVCYEVTDKERKHPLEGPYVTWRMVKDEGWLQKPGSKWKTMPSLMFRYRAAAFWQRTYAPEISLGMLTDDEYHEAGAPVDVPYTDVTNEPAMPAKKDITDEQLGEALEALSAAQTSAEVKQVRAKYREIYDNSEMFREAVINMHGTLKDAEANQAQPETQPES